LSRLLQIASYQNRSHAGCAAEALLRDRNDEAAPSLRDVLLGRG
jgi:hypothetical protein